MLDSKKGWLKAVEILLAQRMGQGRGVLRQWAQPKVKQKAALTL